MSQRGSSRLVEPRLFTPCSLVTEEARKAQSAILAAQMVRIMGGVVIGSWVVIGGVVFWDSFSCSSILGDFFKTLFTGP